MAKLNVSKAIEEMVQEGIEQGIEQGVAKGLEQGLLNNIRNLCDTMSLTIQQAMNALKVPVEEQPKYMRLLDANG